MTAKEQSEFKAYMALEVALAVVTSADSTTPPDEALSCNCASARDK